MISPRLEQVAHIHGTDGNIEYLQKQLKDVESVFIVPDVKCKSCSVGVGEAEI
jgi:hypothetical protein